MQALPCVAGLAPAVTSEDWDNYFCHVIQRHIHPRRVRPSTSWAAHALASASESTIP